MMKAVAPINACWKSVNGATSLDQSFSFSLSDGFNSKIVNLWVQDRAGNVSIKNSSILRVDPNKPPSLAKSWQENFQAFNDSNLDGQDGWKGHPPIRSFKYSQEVFGTESLFLSIDGLQANYV